MRCFFRHCALALPIALLIPYAPAQYPPDMRGSGRGVRLPNGKLQQEEILKADYKKTLKDAAELVDLAEQLKEDLEKNDRHVLSVDSLKKTEQIEKLAKKIRSRLRRF